jgi:hypothetical protein
MVIINLSGICMVAPEREPSTGTSDRMSSALSAQLEVKPEILFKIKSQE